MVKIDNKSLEASLRMYMGTWRRLHDARDKRQGWHLRSPQVAGVDKMRHGKRERESYYTIHATSCHTRPARDTFVRCDIQEAPSC